MQTLQRILSTGLLAIGALGAAATAQARDVYWSIGIGNAPAPTYVSPPPVYFSPPPVVVHRPPSRGLRPVYVTPPPYYHHVPPPRALHRPGRHDHYRGYHYDDDYGPRRPPRRRHRDRDDD